MRPIKKGEKNLKLIEGKGWYIDFTFQGKRFREFAGRSKQQARALLERRRTEKREERQGLRKPPKPDVLFEKFAGEFLELYSKMNKRSWPRDRASLKSLKPFFKGQTLQEIDPESVERYKAQRQSEVSPATINREIACLKTLFAVAVEWGRLESNPILKVKKLREANFKERILTKDEAGALIDEASPELKPILILALGTAMRKSEILSLRWEDIDFHKGFLFVGDSKNGRSRNVPMNGLVFKTLKEISRRSEFVFFNRETKDHVKDVKTAFKGACRRSGIKGLRFHDLRHTAATWMVMGGADLVTVSKILGHSSIEMTMRYAHPTTESMRKAVGILAEIQDRKRQKVDKPKKPASATYLNTSTYAH